MLIKFPQFISLQYNSAEQTQKEILLSFDKKAISLACWNNLKSHRQDRYR